MFPLKQKIVIRGAAAHIAAGLGAATDYVANYEPLYAPFDGIITREYYGPEGGHWLCMEKDGISFEFAHISAYNVLQGATVVEGQQIAITGNTGTITTGPHLHLQLIKDNVRIDPETYDLGQPKEDTITIEQISDVLGRVWHDIHNADPDMTSINNEATDAYNRTQAGERYAVNFYIDKYFNEFQSVPVAVTPPSEYPKEVTTITIANERQATDSSSALVARHPVGYNFKAVAQVEGQIPTNCTTNKWYQTEAGTFIPVEATQ